MRLPTFVSFFVIFCFVAGPTAGFAAGGAGGGNGRRDATYQCKSGKQAKGPKGCKENGGRL